ncbi:glycosyltransferase [Candidatus Aminicenantes bacterium AC-708-M15]|jgi:glycosyltransferase involved in cell wall biosynthesis|nr:glycosyltransferase [SCandidatus Aminicenantes bacterium Aminicenantia_JdfR_composite]MCP2596947.1 glycosyltransferase [Candidatus Aminicenantes bacterium AC-335-G13]MCP2603975.1 glycosyltransferase [Candidatus Aminicenantes bacterium AC-708-M15]MCP2621071.1 glycosyltransferase [Candidatus Aminicenantes bacterium AC-334-E05]
MRIVFISSYPPVECGIATYCEYLSKAVKAMGNEVYIICHKGGQGEGVFPAFDYNDSSLHFKAYKMTTRFTPDIVHIQHEYGLYGPYWGINIVPLIQLLSLNRIPVVTTLHSVYKKWRPEQKVIVDNIIRSSNKVIVHEPYQLESIKANISSFDDKKFSIIPHGARIVKRIKGAKKMLGLAPSDKVILLIGYSRPSKNLDLIIDLFPYILEKVPKARLVVAGKIRQNEYGKYQKYFLNKINRSPCVKRIIILKGQFPQSIFDKILSSADVIPLPYKITAQSGIMAHCLAFGVPLVCSDNPSMRRIIEESGAGFIAKNEKEFVDYIVQILSDSEIRNSMRRKALKYVQEKISWKKIANKTVEIYNELIKTPRGKAKYIRV